MNTTPGQLRVPSRGRWLQRSLAQCAGRMWPDYFAKYVKDPCFVIGCPRSGSSLYDQLLGSHPEIAAYPSEALDLWHPQAYPWHKAARRRTFPPIWADARAFTEFSLLHRTPRQDRLIQASFGALMKYSSKSHFVQKCTMIGLMLPHVLTLFPDARFIHILRDGRATTLSWARRQAAHFRTHPETYRRLNWLVADRELLRYCARAWLDIVEAIDAAQSHLALDRNPFLELKYEALCSKPEETLRRTAEFLGVSAERFDPTLVSAVTSQNFKFSEELGETDQRDLLSILGDTLRRKGYEAGPTHVAD